MVRLPFSGSDFPWHPYPSVHHAHQADMSTLAFDTHKAIKGLKEAGFEEAQAEAVVSALGEAMGENVATKEHVSAEIAALEARLYRHLWLMAAGIVGVTVTLVKLIP